jgi:hypothetical protein
MPKIAQPAATWAKNTLVAGDRQFLMTTKEAASALRVSPRTVAYWTEPRPGNASPRLSYVKLGKAKRFIVTDILRFIEERKIPAGGT